MAAQKIGWGIIGPGRIAHNFADGLAQSDSGALVAIGSRSAARRQGFGDRYGIAPQQRHADYAALIADPSVQAVYIATPHPMHCQLALMALRGGKPVLVEKPAGMSAAEVTLLTEVAAQERRFFMEAFMYRCHPQIARVLEILASGEIGTPTHIRASFGYASAFDAGSRAYDLALGGGGILDVGCYPVSLARLIAGAAAGLPFAEPVVVKGTGRLGRSEVDERAFGLLKFADGFTAEIACAIDLEMSNDAVITGTRGSLRIVDPWVPGRNEGPSDARIEITTDDQSREEWLRDPRMLFAFEVELASAAIAEGRLEAPHPALGWADSIGNAVVLDAWRAELGYRSVIDRPETSPRLTGALPSGLPAMTFGRIPGLERDISHLIMGCDNQWTLAGGAVIWDAFAEAGGNAFDTAPIYGRGQHEAVLGQWLKARGMADKVSVIVKGAHSPYCLPGAILPELTGSLDRLGLSRAPIYVLHRDNPDVPAGEFVEALNALVRQGLIGVFGGSNWSIARLDDANAYANAHGLQGFSVLNNNLSLAVMERPVWPGCVTSQAPAVLARLAETGTAHVSWSSQARGYFLAPELRDRLPEDTRPETCFGSEANASRRQRAEVLAAETGLSANNIALAWVLAQEFPSFALIGSRTVGELATTLPALAVRLDRPTRDWLNLIGERPA